MTLESTHAIAEGTCFARATGRVILWIKIEYHARATQPGEGYRAIGTFELEVRRQCACGEFHTCNLLRTPRKRTSGLGFIDNGAVIQESRGYRNGRGLRR